MASNSEYEQRRCFTIKPLGYCRDNFNLVIKKENYINDFLYNNKTISVTGDCQSEITWYESKEEIKLKTK